MATIDVDFETFKALTNLRESEKDSYNDVVRRLLGLASKGVEKGSKADAACIMKGVAFPEGTEFRVTYKGQTHRASVIDGVWRSSDGISYNSPSRAARAVTGNNVNGWRFWDAKRPQDREWRRLEELRS